MVAQPERYAGREQAYVKHYFLEGYLERLIHKTASAYSDVAYVDGFSGPWQSGGEDFEDTSFCIALKALTAAKQSWKNLGREVRMRAERLRRRSGAQLCLRATFLKQMSLKRFRRAAVLVVAATASTGPALAGHAYTFVSVSRLGVIGFLDTATLERSSGKVTAWTLFIPTRPEKMNGKAVRHALFRAEFDCAAKTRRALYGVTYDPTGATISETPLSGARPIVPDSVDETMLDAACNPDGIHTIHIFENVDAATSFADFSAKALNKRR
jgi:hypothetical protein